jgi:hypothetical protein
LISKIAFNLWNADHLVMQALLLAEQKDRDPFGSPKYAQVRLLDSTTSTLPLSNFVSYSNFHFRFFFSVQPKRTRRRN